MRDSEYDSLGSFKLFGKVFPYAGILETLLISEKTFSFVWVTDFPLLEYDETDSRFVAVHHPFTAPVLKDMGLLIKLLNQNKFEGTLVLVGEDIGVGIGEKAEEILKNKFKNVQSGNFVKAWN